MDTDLPAPPPPVPPVVDAAWLAAATDDAVTGVGAPGGIVLCDVRWYLDGRSGHDAYEAGHLPGAIWVDLDAGLSAPGGPAVGRHPLPDPGRLAEFLGGLGVGDDVTVVAYDDQGGVAAARLVWMLRALGQPAALLDGGLLTWTGPLETGSVGRTPVVRRPRPWPAALLATPDDLVPAASSPDTPAGRQVLVDARSAERYRGDEEPLDPRAGHVPGARNVPWSVGLATDGRFLDPAVLRERFAAAGISDESEVTAYCGSGISACHHLLALERAGFRPGRLYPGSWSQWSNDPGRPVARGGRP